MSQDVAQDVAQRESRQEARAVRGDRHAGAGRGRAPTPRVGSSSARSWWSSRSPSWRRSPTRPTSASSGSRRSSARTEFVGLDNYVDVFTDDKFWDGSLRVLLFLVVQVPIMLGLALVAALAIDSARLYGVELLPAHHLPALRRARRRGGADVGLHVRHQLRARRRPQRPVRHTSVAPLSTELDARVDRQHRDLGVRGLQHADLLLRAAHGARGDLRGCRASTAPGTLRTVLSIKIPALRGAIVIATIFSIIGTFQLFNEPNILRTLEPNVITTYYTPNLYAYNLSFGGQQYNYSATVAIVMGLLTAVIAYVVQLRGSREAMK